MRGGRGRSVAKRGLCDLGDPCCFGLDPSSDLRYTAKTSMVKLVKSIIHKQAENKQCDFAGQMFPRAWSGASFNTQNILPVSPYTSFLQIAQGTTVGNSLLIIYHIMLQQILYQNLKILLFIFLNVKIHLFHLQVVLV